MSNVETPSVLIKIATGLLEENVPAETVARTLEIPLELVNSLPYARTTRIVEIDDVAVETAALIGLAIDQARDTLLNGTPAMRLRLITSLLGKAMSQLRNQSPKAMEALRKEVEKLSATIMDDEDYEDEVDDEDEDDDDTLTDEPR
jgi:hypothetical protein